MRKKYKEKRHPEADAFLLKISVVVLIFKSSYIYYLVEIESTPGNALPSRYSREAPPPVEM
ncbi:MAG: hypothetical protein ACRCZ1_08195 [Cetobacterium sp.]